jgi:hypothetical protein
LASVALSPLACRPTLDDRPWLARAPQIIGWKTEPAEALPGASITLRAGILDPTETLDAESTAWAFCHAPKPIDEDRIVPPSCLETTAADAIGNPVTLTLPSDACQIYGPDAAQPMPGAPTTRPRDPDATGGYYQPVTIVLGDALAVGLARVTCDLPDASLQAARAFQDAYHVNQNPTVTAVSFTSDGVPADPGALVPNTTVRVEATWAAGAVETYALFDRATGAVAQTTETLTASWHVTGGGLDAPTGFIADPSVLSAATTWRLPAAPATLRLGFVLRDSRGGSDLVFASVTTGVGPP